MASGNVAVGGSFVSVGTKKVNIVDIQVSEAAGGYCTAVLQTLNDDGTTANSYYYIYNKKHGGTSGTAGWYLDMAGSADKLITRESGIEFEPGTGFWVQGNGNKITCSGEVLTASDGISIDTLASGNVMIANPYPVAVNIADIGVKEPADGYCTAVAQTLNDDGTTATSYYYIFNKKHGGTSGTAGWYLDMAGSADKLITKESGIELPSGGAYWVQGNGNKIVFPAFTIK